VLHLLTKVQLQSKEVIFIRKRIRFMVLCVIIIITTLLPVSVYAGNTHQTGGEDFILMPRWSNILSIGTHLTIENGTANIAASVIGNFGTESITVSAVLDRANANGTFTNVASWNNMRANEVTWGWEATQNVARGHDYRLTLTVTVVRNGVSETVTVSRTERAD